MNYQIEHKPFIENYFLRSSPARNLDADDPLLPQLQEAEKKELIPRIKIQFLPKGELKRDDFWDGEVLKDEKGNKLIRKNDLYRVWYYSDWEISYKRWEESKQAAEVREKVYWDNKERVEKLKPYIISAGMDEDMAKKIAITIVEKNNLVLEKYYLEEGWKK